MKRLIIILILSVMALCVPSEATEKIKIAFLWWPDPGGGYEEVISDFERENPDIDVEMIKGPTSTDAREAMYVTSFLAKESTYDMVLMDIIWLPKFAEQGWLIPLDDWFTSEDLQEFLPGDIKGGMFKGKLYRIPLQTDCGVLYYRKDLLEEKGFSPPKTWAEFIKIAQELQDPPNLWGFVLQGKQYEGLICNFLEILWSFGADIFNEKADLTLNSPQGIEALEFMGDLIHTYKITPEGIITYEEEETRHIFQEGRAVFCRNWPYMWKLAQDNDSNVRGRIGITPLPHKPGEQSFAVLGGWGFGISRFAKNTDACIKFIKYIAGYSAQKKLHFKSGIVPTRKALFKDKDLLKASPHYSDLYKVLLMARPRPVHPDYAQISDILRRFIHKFLLGEISAQTALERAESEIKKVLVK